MAEHSIFLISMNHDGEGLIDSGDRKVCFRVREGVGWDSTPVRSALYERTALSVSTDPRLSRTIGIL